MIYSSKAKNSQKNLVFLHGWGGSWQSWYPILERLKADYNIFAPDLPGFGNEPIQIPYHLDNYVDFVINFLKTQKIKKPILIGHSFGGAIATKIATDHSYPLEKIILVDAAAIRHPYSPRQNITINTVSSIKKILSLPIIKTILPTFQKIYYQATHQQDSDYAALKDQPILQKTFQNLIQHDLSKILHRIQVPTLVVWGENDLSTPLVDGQKINSLIPRSKIIVYPNSSHFSYLENQDIFVTDIKNFIN
mgnify:CR=1 FL=1